MHLPIPTHKRPPTPGDVIRYDFIEPLGVTQVDLAERLGITPASLNLILRGKRGITPTTALRLERVLGPSAPFWLNLQQIVDLYDAMHSESAKLIRRLKPIVSTAA